MQRPAPPRNYATTDEEEELLLAMAISASLAEKGGPGKGTGTGAGAHAPAAAAPAAPAQPRYPSILPAATGFQPPASSSGRLPAAGSSSGRLQAAGSPATHSPARMPAAPIAQAPPAYPPQPARAAAPTAATAQGYPSPARLYPTQPAPSTSSPARPRIPASALAGASQSPVRVPPQAAKLSQATSASQSPQPQRRRLFTDPNACAGCGKGLVGSYLTAMGRQWHLTCFTCGFCGESVHAGGNTQFAIGTQDGLPYHMDCYRHRYHPTCHVCGTYIKEDAQGRVEYKEQPFWKHTYCKTHVSDGTPQCCSCARFQSKGVEYAPVGDGRHLCMECMATVVVSTKDSQPLYQEVLAFYRGMGMPLPEAVPLMLVDGFTLNEHSGLQGKDTHSSGLPVFHVRGLTLATTVQTIPTIVEAVPGGAAARGLLGGVSSVVTRLGPPKIQCEVSAILIMYCLPRLLTGCIIAHELMHAWLRMKHVAGLNQRVEEGLCQLMAYVWLDQQHGKLQDEGSKRLASFFSYQIRNDTSEVYGDGFRDAYEAFQQRGLTAIINDVLRTGRIS